MPAVNAHRTKAHVRIMVTLTPARRAASAFPPMA